jgi:hypothetical protein
MSIELIDTDTAEFEEDEEEKEKKTHQIERWEDFVDSYLQDRNVPQPGRPDNAADVSPPPNEEAGSEATVVSNGPLSVVELRTLLCKKPLFLSRNARAGKLRSSSRRLAKFDDSAATCVGGGEKEDVDEPGAKRRRRDEKFVLPASRACVRLLCSASNSGDDDGADDNEFYDRDVDEENLMRNTGVSDSVSERSVNA